MSENVNKEAGKPNRVVSILRTLRNNWKKSTFGLILLGFGYDYATDKYRTQQFMRAYCEEARKYGEQSLPIAVKPRHVTVILNPAAKNGKGKALYEKFSSPLLHLAGVRVSLIQTEGEGQARQLMEIMDNTDAILVAGGDGTFHEAITGLLRRDEQVMNSQKIPIGVAPIGKKNIFAKSVFSEPGTTEPRLLAESTMAVIREVQAPIDVMRVQGPKGKPVYAVSSVACGAFRDTDVGIEKYWYYGPLKAKVAYLLSALRGLPGNLALSVSYSLPCQGCSRCFHPETNRSGEQDRNQRRWWHAFIPRAPTNPSDGSQGPDYSKVINEECGNLHHKIISCSNFTITLDKDKSRKAIRAAFEDPLNGRMKFIADGWSRDSVQSVQEKTNFLEFKEAEIEVKSEGDEERWFSIDNEKYEKQDVKISLLSSKVHMYVKRDSS